MWVKDDRFRSTCPTRIGGSIGRPLGFPPSTGVVGHLFLLLAVVVYPPRRRPPPTIDPVTSAPDAIALILELLTGVGLVPGVILLIVGYARRVIAARFEETWGVVIPSPAGTSYPWFRWMDLARELQSAPVEYAGDPPLAVGDEVKVYFDPRNPQKARLDDPSADGRALRLIGWILTGLGAGAGIAQLVLMFLE